MQVLCVRLFTNVSYSLKMQHFGPSNIFRSSPLQIHLSVKKLRKIYQGGDGY